MPEILDELVRNGLDPANTDASVRTRANIDSRQSKAPPRPLSERRSDWRAEAEQLGFPNLTIPLHGPQSKVTIGPDRLDRF